MELRSPAFKQEGTIPSKYTCDGEDISPELFIDHVPKEAKSLVLIMDDPDVPLSLRRDGMWDHWIVFNIPPHCNHFKENHPIEGTYGKNSIGSLSYQGPCPPDREHRYFFKAYALDALLSLKSGATKQDVQKAMQGHILDQALLVGKYKRKK